MVEGRHVRGCIISIIGVYAGITLCDDGADRQTRLTIWR